jgi:hypothetical protein
VIDHAAPVIPLPSGDVLWAIFRRSDGFRCGYVYAATYIRAQKLGAVMTGIPRDELNILWIQEGAS